MSIDQDTKPRSYDLLWLSLALLPLLLVAFLLPLTPHDYWWYLRLGREILESGSVPSADTYSYTFAGQPLINQPWLAGILFWLIYARGGMTLTFLARGLMIALTYGLLWKWARVSGAGPRLASLLVILAGLAGSNNWSVRPQMFAYPLFVLTLLILWSWDRGRRNTVWLIPFIGLLWVNLHASFVFVFLLSAAAVVFGRGDRRQLLVVLGVTLLAALVNPYGIDLWISVADSFVHPLSRGFSAEWTPPSNLGWQMNIFFGWLLASVPLAAGSPRRLARLEWAWFLGLIWLSLSGQRYVIWGLLLLAWVTASWLADWDAKWLDRPAPPGLPALNYALGIAALALSLLAVPGLRPGAGDNFPEVTTAVDTPVAAAAWLTDHPELPGAMFHDLVFSSYLIHDLPSRPVWIDTRFEVLYPAAQFERYTRISRAAPDWGSLLAEDGVNLLMLSTVRQPYLLDAVRAASDWCERFRDRYVVISARLEAGETCEAE
jgi:hypothetical protein